MKREREREMLCVCLLVCRYPDQLAWYVPLSKAFIRKSPDVSKFHRFLVDESDQV